MIEKGERTLLKILTEASGGLTSSYLIKAIKDAGYHSVASDIDSEIAGRYLADEFVILPKSDNPQLWDTVVQELETRKIQCVIPSLDESLHQWAKRKEFFQDKDIYICISDEDVVNIFQDKWLTYQFFVENQIPTPKTSLQQEYSLIKPRFGRGSAGIFIADKDVEMEGNLSQQYIQGIEYTIDVFCDKNSNPIYIVPRKRLHIKDGKSTAGIVVNHHAIIEHVKQICAATRFKGPINMQCIETKKGDIQFLEVNPRIAGGMALGFAATENWVKLIVEHFIENKEVTPVTVKYGLKMMRYYSEFFSF